MGRLTKWLLACAFLIGSFGLSVADELRIPARSFLLPGEAEKPGYGRYSYVLFAEPVNADNRDLYEAVVAAYLDLDEVSGLEARDIEPTELNIAYLLVTGPAPHSASRGWLVDRYDFTRARRVLEHLGGGDIVGPSVVSYATPLLTTTRVDPARLTVFDLSLGPEDLQYVLSGELAPQPNSEAVRGDVRLTGRAFLPAGEQATDGYGLYSYVLFVDPVNAGNRELYLAVLSAYLEIAEISRFVQEGVPSQKLNITYLPVTEKPLEEASASWLLANYDFARAQIIASAVEDMGNGGPYLVSYSSPLPGATDVEPEKLLIQDLSGVPDDLAFLWVKEFIAQARRPRYWDTRAMRRLMLSLRTNISVVARAFSMVRSAYADMESFVEPRIRVR